MSRFLNTSGQPTLGIGICDRCSKKFPLAELYPDPNATGMRVCAADRDQYDPWRLPARLPEDTTLPFYRPDVSVAPNDDNPPSPTATKYSLNGRWYWNI